MPGATVTITETRTNISFNAATNDAGFYTFPSLKDGTYQVVAELSGFKKVLRNGVIVPVNTTIRVDLRMEVGTVEESITVVGESPILQTDRTDTGRILESKMVTDMPLTFNRNFQSALIHVPGSTGRIANTPQFFNSQDSLAVEVNGQPRLANNTMIEGLDNNHKTGPAAGDHPGRRRARNRQRVDQQLRRGVRPLRRRRDERDAQVRHQPAQGQRLRLRQHRCNQRERLLHPPEGADQVSQHRLHRSAARSSATSSSSSATISGRSTTSATSCAPRCRRWRCATATSAR